LGADECIGDYALVNGKIGKASTHYGPILETPQLGADWLLPTVTNAAIDAVIPAELKGKGR
jgi:hypothetical protein